MMALVPYVGKDRAGDSCRPPTPAAPLYSRISFMSEKSALILFRLGRDTVDIAGILQCTPAAAANGLANARERERGQ